MPVMMRLVDREQPWKVGQATWSGLLSPRREANRLPLGSGRTRVEQPPPCHNASEWHPNNLKHLPVSAGISGLEADQDGAHSTFHGKCPHGVHVWMLIYQHLWLHLPLKGMNSMRLSWVCIQMCIGWMEAMICLAYSPCRSPNRNSKWPIGVPRGQPARH